MKAEDIDRALEGGAQREPEKPRKHVDLFTQVLRQVATQPPPAEAVLEAQEQARADRFAAHKKRVLEKRRALAGRIDQRILARLQRCHTPCGMLLGPTGVGKTSAMLWLRAGLPGEWFHARDLGACERHHQLGAGTAPAFDRAVTSRVLYLDDLGTEDPRDVGVLQHVLERRYAAPAPGLATCVTSGLTPSQLSERYGAATMRRITEQHVIRHDGTQWPVLFVDMTGGAK